MQFWLILILVLQSVIIAVIGCYFYAFVRRLPQQTAVRTRTEPKQDTDRLPIQRLLATASRTLNEHAADLGRFEETLGARSAKPKPQGASLEKLLEEMHQANWKVEKSIDSTVASIAQTCGEMLAEEKSELETYRSRTEEFDATLRVADHDKLLVALTSKLVDMVRELRTENASVRTGLENAKDKVIELMARAHSAEQMARIDSLTKLPNRRVFDESHNDLHESFERTGISYAVVLLDLDYFKTVNDQYGHQVGDAVLSMVGQVFADNRRTDDYLCRMGGEEFALLLTKCNLETALRVADRYRQKVESASLRTDDQQVSVTVSCGVAVAQYDEPKGHVLKRADLALYHAKSQGRNRVCADADDTSASEIAPLILADVR
jgi:diguanylate cyclase (GGDEF)-like protein